ncbi:MAG TPA: class I SAM-dependent methyltransferase [Polyangiaceae bacterium]|nr:class I SAM-dependent methyltransferase [Polyangiaceae bacterium]
MSPRTILVDDRLHAYLVSSLREPEVLSKLREETSHHARSGMQISPEQGQFMGFLVEALGAKKAIEIGVFTGYSSIVVALAMPPGGRLVACDVSEEYTNVARRYWKAAGVESRIELRLAPAVETLAALSAAGEDGTFDFAFIDADKENTLEYYERCLRLVRQGGILCFDNALWDGRVADPADQSESTKAIRVVNEKLRTDPRVSVSLVPIGDGVYLARKR